VQSYQGEKIVVLREMGFFARLISEFRYGNLTRICVIIYFYWKITSEWIKQGDCILKAVEIYLVLFTIEIILEINSTITNQFALSTCDTFRTGTAFRFSVDKDGISPEGFHIIGNPHAFL